MDKISTKKKLCSVMLTAAVLAAVSVNAFARFAVGDININGKEYKNAFNYDIVTVGSDATGRDQGHWIVLGEGLSGVNVVPNRFANKLAYEINIDSKYIKTIASEVGTKASALSEQDVKDWMDKLGTGEAKEGNAGLVNGDTLNNAMNDLTNKGLNFSATTGTGHSNLGDTVNIIGSNNNITTKASDNQLVISLSDDLKVKSITANDGNFKDLTSGNGTFNQSLTVKGNTSLQDTVIDDTLQTNGDATFTKNVTVLGNTNLHDTKVDGNLTTTGNAKVEGTLYADSAVIGGTNLASEFNRINGDIAQVGATTSALAALHPTIYDPSNKLDFSVGYGHYDSKSAVALGAFYHPNENTLFNVGGTLSSGKKAINAGLTFKIGPTGQKKAKSVATDNANTERMNQLEAKVARMAKLLEQLANQNKRLIQARKGFKDVPHDHWAAEAVETLHANDVVHGYPDGEFKGDKNMTRYEYAQMLYNNEKRS